MTVSLDLPDIEIDIPGLLEIKNELKRTQAQLIDLQNQVSTQKGWNTALENALKFYGIDISSPPEHSTSLILPNTEFFEPIITKIVSGEPIITNVVSGVVQNVDKKPYFIPMFQDENVEEPEIVINGNVQRYTNHRHSRHNNEESCIIVPTSIDNSDELILSDLWQSQAEEQDECEIDILAISSPSEKDRLETSPNYSRTRPSLHKIPYALPTKSGVIIKSLNSLGPKSNLKKSRRKKGRFTTVKKTKSVGVARPSESIANRHPTPKNSVKLNPGHFIEILPNNSVPGAEASYRCKLCVYERNDLTKVLRHIRVKHLEERKHKCNICSLTFIRNQHLVQHHVAKHKNVGPTEPRGNRRRVTNSGQSTKSLQGSYPSSSSQSQFGVLVDNKKLVATATDNSSRIQVENVDELPQTMTEAYLSQLRRQYQSFTDDENRTAYLCVECGTIDFSEQQMLTHIHSQHNNGRQPTSTPATLFACEYCYKTFRTKAFLQFHTSHCGPARQSASQSFVNDKSSNSSTMVEDFDEGHSSSSVRVNVVRPTFKMNKTSGIMTGGVVKKKKKKYNGVWAFSETEKRLLDSKIENVTNPRPPYVCKICKIVINSSRQSARRHVQKVHKCGEGLSSLEKPQSVNI